MPECQGNRTVNPETPPTLPHGGQDGRLPVALAKPPCRGQGVPTGFPRADPGDGAHEVPGTVPRDAIFPHFPLDKG